jgi:hypothetical protein
LEGKVIGERIDGVEREALGSIAGHFLRANTPEALMKMYVYIYIYEYIYVYIYIYVYVYIYMCIPKAQNETEE